MISTFILRKFHYAYWFSDTNQTNRRDQGHGSMMRTVADTSTALDGGDTAEQMALVITHFAFED